MKHQYEAMFLFDPGFAGDLKRAEDEIRRVMERAEAEIVFCRKWDERKLAYEIKGRKRGVYMLVYFKAAPDSIKGLERDGQISEQILRLLVLRADDVSPEVMEQFAPQAERPAPEREKGRGPDEPAEDTAEEPHGQTADKKTEGDAAVGVPEEAALEETPASDSSSTL